jgi:hypothetical protein
MPQRDSAFGGSVSLLATWLILTVRLVAVFLALGDDTNDNVTLSWHRRLGMGADPRVIRRSRDTPPRRS